MQDAERLRVEIQSARDNISREKAQLQQAVRELQTASESLARQGEALDAQARAAGERELSHRETAARLKLAASSLGKREQEVAGRVRELEGRQSQLGEQERDLTQKKLGIAAASRELSSKHAAAALSNYPALGARLAEAEMAAPQKPSRDQSPPREQPSAWLDSFQQRIKQGMASGGPGVVGSSSSARPLAVHEQVFDARKLLQGAKGFMVRSNSAKEQVNALLSSESSFIRSMQSSRAKAAMGGRE